MGLEPGHRKVALISGQKSRAGRSVWFQNDHDRAGNTPRVGHEGLFMDKAVGGRSVKAFQRFGLGARRRETPRGARRSDGSHRSSETVAIIVKSKALKSRAVELARSSGRRRGRSNGRRAAAGENPVRLRDGVKPLKGKPWTWLWGETNPQGTWWSKPSRAGGTPRTERSVELGSLRDRWTPRVDAAMRDHETPVRLPSIGFGRLRSVGIERGTGQRLNVL